MTTSRQFLKMPPKISRRRRKAITTLAVGLLLLVGRQWGWFETPKRQPPPEPGYYHVIQILDGDTLSVNMNGGEETIRLIGVDTPETHHPRKAVECFGKAASKFTSEVVGQNSVRLEADPLSTNRDRYDRLLRYVYLPDGLLVNLEIINSGYGFAYTHFPFTKSDIFKAAELLAKEEGRGLWSACPVNVDAKGFIHAGEAAQQ